MPTMSAPATRVVITGGEGDLARAIAAHLKEHGFEVEAPGRDQLDVTCENAVRDYFQVREIDLLICNAGTTRDRPLALLTEKDWDEVFDVNLKGTIRCGHAAIESMKQRGGGHVIIISSYSAVRPPIGQVAYATSKASLLGLVDEWATQHGEDNIRINAILPGFLETKMTATVREQRRAEVLAEHMLKQFNTPMQVAAFIRTLHQDLIHTSGQTFQLDSRPHWR